MNKLFILTLHWNEAEKLNKLKESLLPTLEGLDWSWQIRDNDSKDHSISMIESWENPNIILTKYHHNRDNFAEGMNFLFSCTSAEDDDYILLLNNDVIFNDTTSIKNMMACMKPDVGVVGAKLLYTNTNKLQHAGVIFDPAYGLPTHFRCNEIDDSYSKKNRYFQAVTGAVWLTKAKYYKNICTTNKSKIPGLCEDFIFCYEDIDACLSIQLNQNKKIMYCGNTNIFHEESSSLKKNPINKLFMNKNIDTFFKRWHKKYKIDKELYEKNKNYNVMI